MRIHKHMAAGVAFATANHVWMPVLVATAVMLLLLLLMMLLMLLLYGAGCHNKRRAICIAVCLCCRCRCCGCYWLCLCSITVCVSSLRFRSMSGTEAVNATAASSQTELSANHRIGQTDAFIVVTPTTNSNGAVWFWDDAGRGYRVVAGSIMWSSVEADQCLYIVGIICLRNSMLVLHILCGRITDYSVCKIITSRFFKNDCWNKNNWSGKLLNSLDVIHVDWHENGETVGRWNILAENEYLISFWKS